MEHAFTLAERGRGAVEPNPVVGAVVLDAENRCVGEGWHARFGGPHAEVHALAAAGERARGGTLFVTLEPCCHFGKTPPCTEAILAAGVRRVVVALHDPFPKVAGGGIACLRAAGVAVEVGLGEATAQVQNAPYRKLLRDGRPWVLAKWAMSWDGKIATRTGDSRWISSPESRALVHELRGRVDAIIVGRGTVHRDDPLLTARPAGPRVATRVIVTASGLLPEQCQLRKTAREYPTMIVTTAPHLDHLSGWQADGAEIVPMRTDDTGIAIAALLDELGQRRMTRVLLEGGSQLLGSFWDTNCVDEAWIFVAPRLIGGPAPTPVAGRGVERLTQAIRFENVQTQTIGADVWIRGIRSSLPPEQQQ
ncbi:MAG: bifunctional diaminohydroxyphosphoribosylaminopyrimidine deaminase/5-amino-6-(5-phosphoribosylamino)uracil reductase RibD [Bacteroidales bacterium]|nr:bifunctional diaminohydroxyphosphoribosylaminopyrimidine deaminase/5-amino-6-(5-phosphoribosylamino)uracil reductase RibD [Bacteroidales bacterium]